MGMRTIRWRNGQCPRRNGQWAERIAHAGSEAVRLVPFCEAEELSSASYSVLSRNAVSQHGACRGAEMRDASMASPAPSAFLSAPPFATPSPAAPRGWGGGGRERAQRFKIWLNGHIFRDCTYR